MSRILAKVAVKNDWETLRRGDTADIIFHVTLLDSALVDTRKFVDSFRMASDAGKAEDASDHRV